jgi:hypothetical protein
MSVPGPIAIGGVGGSGTRVIATMLQRLGYYLGDDLNRSLDNLWFTMIFRRPRWWARHRGGRRFHRSLHVFLDAMTGSFRLTPSNVLVVADAYRDMVHQYNREWPRARVRSMRRAAGPGAEANGWGWKEPNTHVVLAELARAIPTVRYVHVVRHGLDVAFSDNQHQLRRWGLLYGVPEDLAPSEERSARFWLAANERALVIGREELQGRFHVVDFDLMCSRPEQEVSALLDFIHESQDHARALASLVQPPSSIGRHHASLDRFSHQTVNAVRDLMSGLHES